MSRAFTLHVPSDAAFETLTADVASKFAEIAGANELEAAGFGTEVEAGVHALATADSGLDLTFASNATGLEASIRCGSHTRVIRHALSAARG